jgi:hypothetical protein
MHRGSKREGGNLAAPVSVAATGAPATPHVYRARAFRYPPGLPGLYGLPWPAGGGRSKSLKSNDFERFELINRMAVLMGEVAGSQISRFAGLAMQPNRQAETSALRQISGSPTF